jgi:hypothetical protein
MDQIRLSNVPKYRSHVRRKLETFSLLPNEWHLLPICLFTQLKKRYILTCPKTDITGSDVCTYNIHTDFSSSVEKFAEMLII